MAGIPTISASQAVNNIISSAASKVGVGSFSALGSLGNFGSMGSLLTQTSSNQALSKLSSPVFGAGPKDNLATVDVYNIDNGQVINNNADKLSSFDSGSLGNFRQSGGFLGSLSGGGSSGTSGLLSSLNVSSVIGGASSTLGIGNVGSVISGGGLNTSSLINIVGVGANINPYNTNLTNIGSRVIGSAGGGGSLLGMSNSLQSSLLGGIAVQTAGAYGINTSIFNQGIAVINGVSNPYTSNNLTDTMQVLNLVNTLTTTPIINSNIDVGAQSSVMSSAISALIGVGLGVAIGALIDNASDDSVAKNALQANIQTAVAASDMTTINLLITKLGVGTIRSQMPNFVTALLQAYKIPAGTTGDQYASLGTALVTVLNTVQPAWDTLTRNGEAVSNLAPFTKVSADATKVLSTITTYATALAIASVYPSVDLWTALTTEYPLMVSIL